MELWQIGIISLWGLFALTGFLQSLRACMSQKKSFSAVPVVFYAFGAFVNADLVIFGAFWTLISLISLILRDFILFLLIISIFWLIRSIGETMYWFLQQFSPRKGNNPEKFWFHRIFKDDSVWFVLQIYWQCITVITIITSLYLGKIWLQNI